MEAMSIAFLQDWSKCYCFCLLQLHNILCFARVQGTLQKEQLGVDQGSCHYPHCQENEEVLKIDFDFWPADILAFSHPSRRGGIWRFEAGNEHAPPLNHQ